MGKGTDKLYITRSEWSSSDAYGASAGANAGARAQRNCGNTHASFKRLPFNFCAASLQPFQNPMCKADGTIFDVKVISTSYANIFAWDTVERMNIRSKMWRDLVDDAEFGQAQRQQGGINVDALGRIGDKVLRAKEAVERARQAREAGGVDINRISKSLATSTCKPSTAPGTTTSRTPSILEKKLAPNAAAYTTGLAAVSFTSTGLTPETSGERAVLSDEEWSSQSKFGGELLLGSLKRVTSDTFVELGALEPEVTVPTGLEDICGVSPSF
ncbi:hypothetical protein CHGG_09269 [Chaetomium globosum CBS 148.51]|uniref:Uncharacterized protein n=1 Tax=Chaetomium globosum (strain ATCC 6205 / CBS 148.51 / DSM 1962 / NBRC 6347 / NRRL 1970) TaxID=306901 RepID=Q2GRY5_CHAGB|nr:uncharacterized protein CHGG_09269 [Chaetomium globosum CBS 148.51]EAQ85255.1 hypothetical protein CHGG_09269 [Chaetomium globosum CBS 148.51]